MRSRQRGTIYVPRRVAAKNLHRAHKKQSDPTLLLPPYVSAHELRVIFQMDYASTFKLLNVEHAQSKYFWKDFDGRQFETTSKRKVMIPFEMAAGPCTSLGYRPKMVDVEPDWDPTSNWSGGGGPSGFHKTREKRLESAIENAIPGSHLPPVPVVAVLGHINHGKTTLLDAICGTQIAPSEPGGITQGVRAMTWSITGAKGPRLDILPYSQATQNKSRLDTQRMTFMDTPGHEAFELHRGRTMASADAALVVVSVEHGAEVQTEEVLLHAARWSVPVVFALNKVDLPGTHIELVRAELRRQCQKLHEQGLVDVNWTKEAEAAVPISALLHQNLDGLVRQLCRTIDALPAVPSKSVKPPTSTPGESKACRNVTRRTDYLMGIESSPTCVALVVDVERGSETGEKVVTVIVRSGRLSVGQFFVVGTAFGRITHLSVASGVEGHNWYQAESATVGMAAQVMGFRIKKLGGDCAPDDILFTLPRERAWRLGAHRRRIEELTMVQTAGSPIEVPWEHDPASLVTRTQAAFERRTSEQPEKHSVAAYEKRWTQPAVEEFGLDGQSPRFSNTSRWDFQHESEKQPKTSLLSKVASGNGEQNASAQSRTAGGGRKSRMSRKSETELEARAQAVPDRPLAKSFMMVQPAENDAKPSDDAKEARGGGRRSTKKPAGGPERIPSGAWSSDKTPDREMVYYVNRKTFEEEADIDSTRLRARWRWRDQARWEEEERQLEIQRQDKKLAEAVRREVFGEPPLSDSEDELKEEDLVETEEEEVQPLPERGRPVVSLILKTRTMGQFDVLMDEIDQLQGEYGVRVAIVHGGLGPVIPKDVVHAEIEKSYGFCPIYAFQVGSNPPAAAQADTESIDIRRFDVFTDLISDLAERCDQIQDKLRLNRYTENLRQRPTASGL